MPMDLPIIIKQCIKAFIIAIFLIFFLFVISQITINDELGILSTILYFALSLLKNIINTIVYNIKFK